MDLNWRHSGDCHVWFILDLLCTYSEHECKPENLHRTVLAKNTLSPKDSCQLFLAKCRRLAKTICIFKTLIRTIDIPAEAKEELMNAWRRKGADLDMRERATTWSGVNIRILPQTQIKVRQGFAQLYEKLKD